MFERYADCSLGVYTIDLSAAERCSRTVKVDPFATALSTVSSAP
jgi:hypothetical protein